MATVFDVAAYILGRRGEMTAMKLQKLVYYSQAWSLVWDDQPMFGEPIEAWANGPVTPALFSEHKGRFRVKPGEIRGNANALTAIEKETIDAVLDYYGDKSSQWLSDLTHQEDPWRNARKGLDPGERGCREITHEAMVEYYSSLASES